MSIRKYKSKLENINRKINKSFAGDYACRTRLFRSLVLTI